MMYQNSLSVCMNHSDQITIYEYPCCTPEMRSMQCSTCGHIHVFDVACRNRLCTRCLLKRALRLLKRFKPLVLKYRQPALLTLTCRPQLYLNFREIRRQFRVFRHYYSKIHIEAGLYVLETKQKEDGWHTHIHAVIDSSYYPQAKIGEEWEKSTGGLGFIVDIRRVNSAYALIYLLKYLSKNHEIANIDGENQFTTQSRNSNLIQTFGDRYGFHVEPPDPYPCTNCGSTAWTYDVDANFSSTKRDEFQKTTTKKYKNEDDWYGNATTKERNSYDLAMSGVW